MDKDVYVLCPDYGMKLITLQKTDLQDAKDLLSCYSDEKAVPFFNSDNCHGDDFHYTTMERMIQAIEFWNYSYDNRYFVRWSVVLNETKECIGTIEMFHRLAEDDFNHYGVLRIDLRSDYETEAVIDEILQVVKDNFYQAFDVKAILTKAVPLATNRIASLLKSGFQPINRKFMIYDDYYVRYA